jgi:copper chaperone CopZ
MVNKTYKSIATLIVIVFLAISCSGNKSKGVKDETAQNPSLIEVSIKGMTCTGCEQTIQTRVGGLEGVKSVKASFVTGKAMIEYLPGVTDTVKIKEMITGSGYGVVKFNPVESGVPME